MTFKIEPGMGEYEIWAEYFKKTFSDLPENVFSICEYSFLEMLNNAIDHSEGKSVTIRIQWKGDVIEISIFDNGIGIFRKIAAAFDLEDERECILQLSKGKLTTDPDHHSGEGIFFTSHAVDKFYIGSHELAYLKDNLEEDWFVETRKEVISGTGIILEINRKSDRNLKEVFDRFTFLDEDDVPGFGKTHILVGLSKLEKERYVSRSQAKRLLLGLEKFQHVIVDFTNVEAIGQAFVDEVFRVFPLRHPGIKIEYVKASDDVKFMIERGLGESSRQIPLPFSQPKKNSTFQEFLQVRYERIQNRVGGAVDVSFNTGAGQNVDRTGGGGAPGRYVHPQNRASQGKIIQDPAIGRRQSGDQATFRASGEGVHREPDPGENDPG
ncbi:MAG: DUF4325 domain-containing protein [Nitrospinae bacterium]|nr:DUF4325 domain-containing protein [Nitrospinota bacterium]